MTLTDRELDTNPAAVPATGRLQLALRVSDLDRAIEFYSTLFDAAPAKVKPGYANFAIEMPPLKLVLIEGPGGGQIDHLGVEVADTQRVDLAAARLRDSGLVTLEENESACCYAVQDKVWVAGPDAERWEVYTVLGDSETFGGETHVPERSATDAADMDSSATACCADGCCS